ncbi:MBL fold metallo-hydrolase [Chitinophaga tropicalis]|uniref:MBL fold metallo-hydrolase n=1 Tax=Chitinophaga tropicalis TaxID=2683588 RepID=A0A7K1U921_9BACT|nr:MBL fold metallo-hydrolase [Chitinophaga tropicalis]MVT10505.1 MBL fold metallo-hydrolase [Chitinophaga tropicalis]
MNRRDVIRTAALAGLAAALPGIALSKAKTGVIKKNAGYYRFNLGELELVSVTDGHIPVKPLQPVIAPGIPAELVNKELETDFLPAGESDFAINVLVIKQNNRVILIDAGSGSVMGDIAGRFVENLTAAGIKTTDVTDIVITHMHGDHIGGLLSADGSHVFPRAAYYLPAKEHAFWSTAHPDFSRRKSPHPDWDKGGLATAQKTLEALKEKVYLYQDGDILLDCLEPRTVPGHTPGHSIITIRSGGETLVHIADTVHSPLLLAHPEWGTEWDTDFEQGITSRKSVLKELAEKRLTIYGYHLPWPGIGHIRSRNDGFEWVPRPVFTP